MRTVPEKPCRSTKVVRSGMVTSQDDAEDEEEKKELKGCEGKAATGQQRGKGLAEQSKHRATIEACQAVLNYFKEGEDPVGVVLSSSLVVCGQHARLSNLDDEGRFIRDEHIVVRGKEVMRRAGSKARGLMRPWIELRKSSPEARKMLEVIDVYQQPNGFVDSIVMAWVTERASERIPIALHQRDLFAGALSETAKRASFLSHQAQTWIGGKMTAVLQLTDTDMAFPMKAGVREEKSKMKAEMRALAIARGEVVRSPKMQVI